MSSIGRTRLTSSNLLALSVGLTAFSGVALTASQIIEKLTQKGTVSVNFENLAWWSRAHVQTAEVDEVQVAIAESVIEEKAFVAGSEKIPTPKALKKHVRKTKKLSVPLTMAVAKPVELPTVQPILVTDKIRVIQSNQLDEVPSAPEPEKKSDTLRLGELISLPSAEEQKAMQDIYAAMTRRFYVAVHTIDLKNSPTLIADSTLESVPDAPVSLVDEYIAQGATVIEEPIAPLPEVTDPEVPVAQTTPQTPSPSRIVTTHLDEIPGVQEAAPEVNSVLSPVTTHSTPERVLTTQTEPPQRLSTLDEVPDEPIAAPRIARIEPPKQAAPPDPKPALKTESKTTSAAPAAVAVLGPASQADVADYEADIATSLNTQPDEVDGIEYSPKVTPKTIQKVVPSERPVIQPVRRPERLAQNSRPSKASSIYMPSGQKTAPVEGVEQDANGITIAWSKSSGLRSIPSTADELALPNEPSREPIPEPKKSCDTALIGREAFNLSSNETLSVCRRALSLEGSVKGSQSKWWEVRESSAHWPTIVWQDDREAFRPERRVPLISNNNVKLLSAIARVSVQPSAGIVFGEIPAGLEIQITGRSEPVIFFDATLKPVEPGDVSRSRYFAFLNVAPGNPVLQVSLRGGSRGGAIPIVVKPGFSTFVRVPMPQLKTLESRVFDASSRVARGIPSLSVQVIGQDGKTAVTDTRGAFEVRDVVTFGDYPIYVDVAPNEKSFKHRYRIRANEMKDKALFYFSENVVSHWVSQLEGGVSPFSGLVVGAVPAIASENAAFIRIGSFDRKDSLSPEAYALSNEETLKGDQKLGNGNVRFIGVQIPEGPNVPTILAPNGEALWSELVIAQPGVINVVGP